MMTKTLLQYQYDELAFYTLSLQDEEFIHQHIVDAQTVQTADELTKPISLIFSLAGLYLYIEKNFTGKGVQRFHMMMAKNKMIWPQIILPLERGVITVTDVLNTKPGEERIVMIYEWCASIWKACKLIREDVVAIVDAYQ